MLDDLEAADWSTELVADFRVIHAHIQAPLRAANLLSRERDRRKIERSRQPRPCLTIGTYQTRRRALEFQAGELARLIEREQWSSGHTAGIAFNCKQRDTRGGPPNHQDQIGDGPVDHERFMAVQDPVRASTLGDEL